MLRSLQSGVTGIQQFQEQMDVIGNNIANVNTAGFKGARVEFADAFSQTLEGTSASGTGGIQVGTGVTTSTVANQFTQGALSETGARTHLAINGDGFFLVRNSVDGSLYATRAGEFRLDNQGYLVNSAGYRVQGFTDAGGSTRGDIQINNNVSGSTAAVEDFNIGADGTINVKLTGSSTPIVRGQVLLQDFVNPQALLKEGGSLYSNLAAAGPLPATAVPGTTGLGTLKAGALEMSNVDLANEFATLITTQRAFQASARMITSSDEILQEVVNLIR